MPTRIFDFFYLSSSVRYLPDGFDVQRHTFMNALEIRVTQPPQWP
jgi:hypothetical protein